MLPMALANFAPWPEQGEATMIRGSSRQPVDDELVAIVRARVGFQRVGVEADVTFGDRSCGAGQKFGERRAHRLQLPVIGGLCHSSAPATGPCSWHAALTPRPSKSGKP